MRLVKLFLVGTLVMSGCSAQFDCHVSYPNGFCIDRQYIQVHNTYTADGLMAHTFSCPDEWSQATCLTWVGDYCGSRGYTIITDQSRDSKMQFQNSGQIDTQGANIQRETDNEKWDITVVCKGTLQIVKDTKTFGDTRNSVIDNIEHTNPYDPLKDSRK